MGKKRERHIGRWIVEKFHESFFVKETFNAIPQRAEHAVGTLTTMPHVSRPLKAWTITSATRGENKNTKLAKKDPPNGFTKSRLGDDVIREMRQDGWWRNIQLATAFIAGNPIKNRRMKRTATRRRNHKHLTIVRCRKHGTTRCPHSTLEVVMSSWTTQILVKR